MARVLEFGVRISVSESELGVERGGVQTSSSPAGAGIFFGFFFVVLDVGLCVLGVGV